MKKILLSIILFTGFYAQAESMPQAESLPQTESVNTEQEKKGLFFSFSTGTKSKLSSPRFLYDESAITFTFGSHISEQMFLEAGLELADDGGILFRYGYSVMKGRQWIPGVDISLTMNFSINKDGLHINKKFAVGPHLKTFVSKSFVFLLRTGVLHIPTNRVDFKKLDNYRIYFNLGLQWHFYSIF